MNKLITTLILTSLIASGCVLGNKNQNTNTNTNQGGVKAYPSGEGPAADATKKDNEIVSEGVITDSDIPGWKTYSNEDYGFEISYPKSWQYRDSSFNPTAPYKGDCIVFYYETNDKKKIQQYSEKLMADINVCKVYNAELIKYLKDLGYDISPAQQDDQVLFKSEGGAEYWFYLERVYFKNNLAIFYYLLPSGASYNLSIQKGSNVYSVSYSSHPEEFSKEDLEKIVNTIEFMP